MPTDDANEIDAVLSAFQQGDAFVGDFLSFLHVADLSRPLSPTAAAEASQSSADDKGLASIGTQVPGFVLISQTCDVVKPCTNWNFVQVAALRKVDPDFFKSVKGGFRPSYVFVPGLENECLVGDLDLLMTIEKSVLAGFPKESFIRGLTNDTNIRAFAESVARRFSRFAFPEDFVTAVRPIQERLKDKHGRNSPEGEIYRSLREIRVVATPSWDASQPSVEFLFVKTSDGPVSDEMDEALSTLMTKFLATGKFGSAEYRIVSLAAMSAAIYVASDPLDLDHLSGTA
jgi:hypothetical protein